MGRQAYLTRLAFGRSAYEPPEPAQPSDPPQPLNPLPNAAAESSTRLIPDTDSTQLYEPAEQQYNERGRPVNPQSRAFARELRAAQNDVLAAVGVCIRNSPPDEERRASKQDPVGQREDDELWSSIISLTGVIVKQTSVWWVGALRDRLMAYRISRNLTFTEILSTEISRVGPAAFFFAGAPLYYSAIFLLDEEEWIDMLLNAIRRLIAATVSSRERRTTFEELLSRIRPGLLFLAELFTSPALLHMTLQGIHISSQNLFIPPWRAFIPFSKWSPVQIPTPTAYNLPGLAHWAAALSESPVLMIWLYGHAIVDTHGWLFCALRSRVLKPVNEGRQRIIDDSDAEDDDAQSEVSGIGTGRNLRFLDRALCFLGWGVPRATEQAVTYVYSTRVQPRQSISIPLPAEDSGNNTSDGVLPQIRSGNQDASHPSQGLGVPSSTDGAERSLQESNESLPAAARTLEASGARQTDTHAGENAEPPNHPVSPISTVADDLADPTDASIRIASSEVDTGAVSLEIALPEEQRPLTAGETSSHREGARSRQDIDRTQQTHKPEPRAVYNVTDLSIEPAEMLSYVLADCLANWILIPARICIIYRLAQHYGPPGGRPLRAPFVLLNGSSLSFPGLKDLPVIAGRVALCCMLEGLICASFWGIECGVVVSVGMKWFGWKKKPKPKPKTADEIASP